ncbi:hypothetical protein KEM54_001760 [Ascosphaera aggregata]|nr:hypothetical protein KEM54_001760 [Ascosphaera aggregata]
MTFTSDIRDADILLDVQGSRVLIQWPQRERSYDGLAASDAFAEHEHEHHDDDDDADADADHYDNGENAEPTRSSLSFSFRHDFHTSPSKNKNRATLPPSSPVLHPQAISAFTPISRGDGKSLMTPSSPVVVYEDRTSPNRVEEDDEYDATSDEGEDKGAERTKEKNHNDQDEERENIPTYIQDNNSSDYEPDELSELDDDDIELSFDASQQIINSSRARSSSRGHTRSNNTATTSSARQLKKTNTSTSSKSTTKNSKSRSSVKDNGGDDQMPPTQLSEDIPTATIEAIRNHAVNQLAFSRLNSAPLSTILNHLPPEYWRKSSPSASPSHTFRVLTRAEIKIIIEGTPCIGVVNREGKDAAGKPLESEYYYIPDADGDEVRSIAVTSQLMKPGLRSCRKQHKWVLK